MKPSHIVSLQDVKIRDSCCVAMSNSASSSLVEVPATNARVAPWCAKTCFNSFVRYKSVRRATLGRIFFGVQLKTQSSGNS